MSEDPFAANKVVSSWRKSQIDWCTAGIDAKKVPKKLIIVIKVLALMLEPVPAVVDFIQHIVMACKC